MQVGFDFEIPGKKNEIIIIKENATDSDTMRQYAVVHIRPFPVRTIFSALAE